MTRLFHKFFRLAHLPTFFVVAVLFFLSSQPGGTFGHWLDHPVDKVVHAIAFAGLGWSLCVWIRGARWQRGKLLYAIIVVVCVSVFGATDEFHQSFVPGRSVSAGDWLADTCGGIIAVLSYLAVRGYRFTDRLPR